MADVIDPREIAALHDTERTCPFNNFANAYVLHGQVPDPRFGGDCLYQAKMMGERLRAAVPNIAVTYHNQSGEDTAGHIVAFAGEGDERRAFEVTSLAASPFSLSSCRGRANAQLIPTFPLPPTGNRAIRCFWLEHYAQLHMMLLNDGASTLCTRTTTDRSIVLPAGAHPIDAMMARLERPKLVLQVLEPDHGVSKVQLDMATGAMKAQRVGAEIVSETRTKAFDGEVGRIAGILGVSRAQLVEFFREGEAFEQRLRA